jgi:preprotein translocase subunit SecA
LRAKGINDDDNARLTYSGPSETGGTSVRQAGGSANGQADGTRKERRAAARAGAKGSGSKPPKSRRKR